MSLDNGSRFAARDRGLRRVWKVTVWSATGSAGLAVAAAIALVPATASPAAHRTTTDGSRAATSGTDAEKTPAASPSRRAAPGDAPPARTAHPRSTTRAPRLTPPTAPPATTDNGGQHAGSGGS